MNQSFVFSIVFVMIFIHEIFCRKHARETPKPVKGSDFALGIFVGLAIPVQLDDYNVFVSYNFEASFNNPVLPTDYIPGPLNRVVKIENEGKVKREDGKNVKEHKNRKYRTIFTRVGIYTMIESRFNACGLNGKKCLLYAICESSRASFLKSNGILGHILHIVFTPSASAHENDLPLEYYKAELFGLKENCSKYEKFCELNILNLFSTVI